MIFWTSIFLCLACIFSAGGGSLPAGRQAPGGKTTANRQLNKWDILFFLSSWQLFNLGTWENYLGMTVSDPYRVASTICSLLTVFYIIRRKMGISITFSIRDMKEWLVWTAILLVILLPIGFYAGFLKMPPYGRSPVGRESQFISKILLDYFFFVAVTEELVWRGFIQNLLKRTFNHNFAISITTLMFATMYSHIAGGGNFPNWPYVGMALIAGSAYGISYYRTNNILVPILLHGTVDSVWRIFFS